MWSLEGSVKFIFISLLLHVRHLKIKPHFEFKVLIFAIFDKCQNSFLISTLVRELLVVTHLRIEFQYLNFILLVILTLTTMH